MKKTANLTVLYFASLREALGQEREEVSVLVPISVENLVAHLKSKSSNHANAFENSALLRCAVNQNLVDFDKILLGGEEVALFPPVTGG